MQSSVVKPSIRLINFDLLRLLLAWLVLFSHTFALFYGSGNTLIFNLFPSGEIGVFAVYCFFTLSGFLITESYVRMDNADLFVKARFLRIFPAYVVVVLIATFLIGPVFTNLDVLAYLQNMTVYKYVAFSIFQKANFNLPGVFYQNPYPYAVNGSLWTIYYELRMYFVTLALGFFGVFKSVKKTTFALLALILLLPLYHGFFSLESMDGVQLIILKMHLAYLLGSLTFFYQKQFFSTVYVFAALVFANVFLDSAYVSSCLVSYCVLFIGVNRKLNVFQKLNISDVSYGLYLYAFLIQQAIIAAFPQLSFLQYLVYSTLLSVFAGWLSFVYIEKPFLKLRYKKFEHRFLQIEKFKEYLKIKVKILQKASL